MYERRPYNVPITHWRRYQNALARAEAQGLPQLAGTDAQVRWATVIRDRVLRDVEETSTPRRYEDILIVAKVVDKASWWISDGKSPSVIEGIYQEASKS